MVNDWKNIQPEEAIALENFGWIVEGTAAAAEDSAETMSRSQLLERALHPLDVRLTASHYLRDDGPSWIEYRAQDFWVYFGLKNGLGLDYLKPLFARGASPDAANSFFAEEYQSSLGAEYWSWVKNQAIEKTIDFDGRLTDPCHVQTDLIGTVKQLLYPPIDALAWVDGSLGRLTSAGFRIIFRTRPRPADGHRRGDGGRAGQLSLQGLCRRRGRLRRGRGSCAHVRGGARAGGPLRHPIQP